LGFSGASTAFSNSFISTILTINFSSNATADYTMLFLHRKAAISYSTQLPH
jgi:hypothetical protein